MFSVNSVVKNAFERTHSRAIGPDGVKPMLATLADAPFDDPQWVFEVKWDGYRLIIHADRGRTTLWTRNGLDAGERYPAIRDAFARFKHDAVIDGELVALDERGRPRFQLMQNAGGKLVFYAFDLLRLDGRDLRPRPLIERKAELKRILPKHARLRTSDHVAEHGISYFRAAERQGLEGIMAKRADSPYLSGRRSADWLKIKTSKRQEVVVIGYTEPRGARQHIGSLLLAVRNDGSWKYVGHTGGSMGGRSLEEVRDQLAPLTVPDAPADVPREVRRNATWVRPKVVAEVRFTEWTEAGTMRHPVVVGFRDDKDAEEVVMEQTKAVATRPRAVRGESNVQFSNLEKIYFPEAGYTKGDLIEYYDRIADTILPYLKDRPMVLNRHPNGIARPGFFQKDSSDLHLPDFVQTTTVESESSQREIRYVLVNNKETLLYAVNLGCIELNPWQSKVGHLKTPDFYVIDVDPGERPFGDVIRVARECWRVLDQACETPLIKTSGKRGLHICIPLRARYAYDEVRDFSKLVCTIVQRRLPGIASLEHSPRNRGGKIFLDYLRNGFGQTAAAVYSARPNAWAGVSTPLDWREVRPGLDPRDFTIKTIFARLKRKGDLWKPILGKGVDLRESMACLERELAREKVSRRK